MNIFITGITSGIGKALALKFANEGHKLFGIGRRSLNYSHENIYFFKTDMKDIGNKRMEILSNIEQIDIAILNAGVLGKIQKIQNANEDDLKNSMQTNLWSQKIIIDNLLNNHKVKCCWGISSGAALKGNKGWAGYALSKASFKMLMELYSSENSQTQFLNIAPGLVNTHMQDILCDEIDKNEFPNMQRLFDARENGSMLSADQLATKFYEHLNRLQSLDSGDFIDLRNF